MKAPFVAIFLMFCLGSFAQIVKYATEIEPFSLKELDNSKEWNFFGRQVLQDNSNGYAMFDAGIFYGNFGQSCRAYAVSGDSIYFRGYNIGRGERMNVTNGVGFCSNRTDSEQKSAFSGVGQNKEGLPTQESGLATYSMVGSGLLICGADTLRNVSLHRMEFNSVKTVADTLSTEEINFIVYAWTAPGSVFPIAVQHVTKEHSQLYTRPLEYEVFEVDEERPTLEEETVLRVLESADVEVGAKGVRISFPSDVSSFEVDVYLLDAAGNVYGYKKVNTTDEYGCVLDISGLNHGQYIVALNLSEDPALNHKILVVL